MTKSIILLSGGLDSLVSLGLKKEELNVTLALTFDYGQKSAKTEIDASRKICEYYGIEHRVIKLDWLKDITTTSLVAESSVPTGNELDNKEEAQTFSDNTQEFIDAVNKEFEFSTQIKPKVVAPLINCVKNDIVMLALKHRIPLEYTRSCYQGTEGHCGVCESCTRLKHALEFNKDEYYIKILFG